MDAVRNRARGQKASASARVRAGPAPTGAVAASQVTPGTVDAAEIASSPALSRLVGSAAARLMSQVAFEPLIGPPPGTPLMTGGTLISPGYGCTDPAQSYLENLASVKEAGIPRFPRLTPVERRHETAFAGDVQQHLEHYVEGVELMAKDERLGTLVFEPDGVKRQYPPYGTGAEPQSDAERAARAEANHALHPAATVVARLAFLKRLDALRALPEGDPARTVFATAGGCAAGKSDMDEAVRQQFGGFPFGAMWDAAGEADSLDNAWVLQACEARGLKVVFAFAANDAPHQYPYVLNRGRRTGRYVDAVTFASSYTHGTRNMRAFLSSPAYLKAEARGVASTLAMDMGAYDKLSEKDHNRAHYPRARLLGDQGIISAADVPAVEDLDVLVGAALKVIEKEARALRAEGRDPSLMLQATVGSAEKFVRAAGSPSGSTALGG
ncbi:MAG: hypothetical protein IPJ65_24455 [Archangiaceae bacterium]|nr:hypothetical protein [Archangiaceae bacterium]